MLLSDFPISQCRMYAVFLRSYLIFKKKPSSECGKLRFQHSQSDIDWTDRRFQSGGIAGHWYRRHSAELQKSWWAEVRADSERQVHTKVASDQ